MIQKLSLTPSIRIRTTSQSKKQSIIKQQINNFVKQNMEEKHKISRERLSIDYLPSHSKSKDEQINFVAQKVLNPINLNSRNPNKKKLTLDRIKSPQEPIPINSLFTKNQQPIDFQEHLKVDSTKNNNSNNLEQLKLSNILQNFQEKASQTESKTNDKLQKYLQFNMSIRPIKFNNRQSLSKCKELKMRQSRLQLKLKTNLQIFRTVNIELVSFNLTQKQKTELIDVKNKESLAQICIKILQEKQFSQYEKIKQLKKHCYQSFKNHLKYLQKLGHSIQLYEQRSIALEKYYMKDPIEYRQKRVYELMNRIRKRQQTVQMQFKRLLKRKQSKCARIQEIINQCSNQFKNITISIKSLLNVFQKIFQDANQKREKRMLDRIINHVNYWSQVGNKAIQVVSQVQKNKLNIQTFQKEWNLLQADNAQRVILQKNCIKKILQNFKSAYQLFGQQKKIINEQEQFQKFTFNEKYQKIFNKRCENCIFIKAKAQILSNKNKLIKPQAKILNEIIKEPYKNWQFETQIIDKQFEQSMKEKISNMLEQDNQIPLFCYKLINN